MRDISQQKTTRDSILDATDRLLARYGYKKMTIEDLAKEVGIGKGSVYLHFKSKEEIALSHIDRIITRMRSNLAQIARSDLPVEKRLRKMILERVLFRFDSVQHYSQSLNEMLAQLRPKLLERRRNYFETEARLFKDVIDDGARLGKFEMKDGMAAARALIDATNALLPYSLSAYELGDRGVIKKKAQNVADLILNGLLKR
ncbi:MAG TPA: TetR/AcrR family transcriptional regulator [Pyrinomonadaceae bacterium]|nr:TetR/AcrR family transcriptional regulator [Pyrinomonadaceae bacterium]